jgi:hypothetical protein
VSKKKFITIGFFALILVAVACFETKSPSEPEIEKPPVTTTTAEVFGTFRIQLIPEVVDPIEPSNNTRAFTNFIGKMKDGPSCPTEFYKETMVTGQSKLFKTDQPFCSEKCQSGYKCVGNDSCMRDPKTLSVGNITLTGMKSGGEPITVVSEAFSPKYDYMIVSPYPDYPPAAEGDTITMSAAGSGSVDPFTIKLRCIAPLVVLNGEIVLDGKDVTLEWEPPKVEGVSTISIRFNLSYHGVIKGEIKCETEDDGSVTIPGKMLDELKSYGTAGYPAVYLTRQSVVVDEATKVKATVECTITKLLTIPGEISCSGDGTGDGVCPEGKQCIDRKCQ